MIVEVLCNWFLGAIASLLQLLPDNAPPAWLSSVGGFVGTVYGYAGQMGVWFPITLVRDVVLAVLAASGLGFGLKLLRIVASFLSAGGGGAG